MDDVLLELLVCPRCKGRLTRADDGGLACRVDRLVFPVRDGVPVMLIDEARPATEQEVG